MQVETREAPSAAGQEVGLGAPTASSATFTSEEAARNAFREIRLRTSAPIRWAQLAVVDENRRSSRCACSIGAEPGRQPRFHPTHPTLISRHPKGSL